MLAYQLDGNYSPFPLDYIIDRDGIIQYGATEYAPDDMRIMLDVLLAQCQAATHLTVYRTEDAATLRWAAPLTGQFKIYSTDNILNVFPSGWTLEATVPASGQAIMSYVDSTPFALKKYYTVTHMCQ
jgi:hypothetical protein